MGNTFNTSNILEIKNSWEEDNIQSFIECYVNTVCNMGFLAKHFKLDTYEDLYMFVSEEGEKEINKHSGRITILYNRGDMEKTFCHVLDPHLPTCFRIIRSDEVDVIILNKIVEELLKRKLLMSNFPNRTEQKEKLKEKLEIAMLNLLTKDSEINQIVKDFNTEQDKSLDKYDPLKLISFNSKIKELKDQREFISKIYDNAKNVYDNHQKSLNNDIIAIKNIELFTSILMKV
jgi:hypothetical protein